MNLQYKCYNKLGDLDKALKFLENKLSLLNNISNSHSIRIAKTQFQIAMIYKKMNKLIQAMNYMDKAYTLYGYLEGDLHPKT